MRKLEAAMTDWKWREKCGATSGLLYEPGNWGDILKCEWLLRIIEFVHHSSEQVGEYLDLFAGLPTYPLSCRAAARFAALPDNFILKRQAQKYIDNEQWPAAARLVLDNFDMEANVFDGEALRRSEWGGLANCLDLNDGWDFLPVKQNHQYELILLDPYDFLSDWRANFERLMVTVKNCPTLLYMYNRSGRSRERLRDYRLFCNHVRDSGVDVIYGRAAADAFLADSWHELFFFAQGLSREDGFDGLRCGLREACLEVQRIIQTEEVFGEY